MFNAIFTLLQVALICANLAIVVAWWDKPSSTTKGVIITMNAIGVILNMLSIILR